MAKKPTHTVFDNTTGERYDYADFNTARICANRLLAAGHKIRLKPYSPPKRYIDYLAEQGPPEGYHIV